MMTIGRWPILVMAAGLAIAGTFPGDASARSLSNIEHIVVIYLENRSFDNLYGLFPGAENLVGHKSWPPQVDRDGQPYRTLPPVMDNRRKPAVPDHRFSDSLPNAPFLIDQFVTQADRTGEPVHRFYQSQEQIDGGKNDKFVAVTDVGGLVMGFYDGHNTRLWALAERYTLADNFFTAAFGGSFLNHFWLICACTPRYDNAPADITAKLDGNGDLLRDGAISPDGYAVNTIQSAQQPHSAAIADKSRLLPPVKLPTIGDALSAKKISWAWYSGGWNDALAGRPARTFQFHHQPFAYFANYADGSDARRRHLKDETDLYQAIAGGSLPAVTFYKPLGGNDQHPGYANITDGDNHAADLIEKIEKSPLWRSTAIFVTYDENGGFWDHVPPPQGDRWGPGTRVPLLVISPLAKRHFVDHTRYDTTSILKFIEKRFVLSPLGPRDTAADGLDNAFDLAE